MTTNKPTVRKHGTWWCVYASGRMWSSTPRFDEAIERAHGIASYARRIRFQRDLTRTRAAINRMESR